MSIPERICLLCPSPAITKRHCKRHRDMNNARCKKYKAKLATPEMKMKQIGVFK